MKRAIYNWSGGKDSSLALHYLMQTTEYDIKYLLTSISEEFNRISMHGVRVELLESQAESIGIPLKKLIVPQAPSMETYNEGMKQMLTGFKDEGIDYSIFGDIFLEDLKEYREQQLAKVSMKGVFPIWKTSTTELIRDFIDLGFKAVLVCINQKYLDKSFAGRHIDDAFLKDLPSNVDPCGENGEFHSFVYDGPIFNFPIDFEIGKVVYKEYKPVVIENDKDQGYHQNMSQENPDNGFWYCDLIPDAKEVSVE